MREDEIWEKGEELGLSDKLGTNKSQQPWKSVYIAIYNDIKSENPTFKQVSKRPTLYALADQTFSDKQLEKRQTETESFSESTNYNERCLHPVLVKYLYSSQHFMCLAKTIYHENSKRTEKNANRWTYPDLIGIYFPFDDYEKLTLDTLSTLGEKSFRVFSFEMKKDISLSNLREYYFQAVSNSTWANEGYLVAPVISCDEDFLSELSLLNNTFGIGVIRLAIDHPEQSEILFYSRKHDTLDTNMLNKLIERNEHVSKIFTCVNESNNLKKVVRDENTFDQVLDDEVYYKYLAEKQML